MSLAFSCDKSSEILNKSEEYWEQIRKTERLLIEKVPIWEDFAQPSIEQELRKFLLPFHLKQATHVKAITGEQQIETMVQAKELISLKEENTGWFFYNVPPQYQYARPAVWQVLKELEAALDQEMQQIGVNAKLKFAISSAIRPTSYQEKLRSTNENAALLSSHSFGLSVDIFHDEYFLAIPTPMTNHEETKQFLSQMRSRIGYLLGAALRRQLRTILTKALLELQRAGKIYVILEKKQRCYHLTPVIQN